MHWLAAAALDYRPPDAATSPERPSIAELQAALL